MKRLKFDVKKRTVSKWDGPTSSGIEITLSGLQNNVYAGHTMSITDRESGQTIECSVLDWTLDEYLVRVSEYVGKYYNRILN